MLGERILTAFMLVVVLALVIVVLPAGVAVLALGLLILVGAWEWSQLAGLSGTPARLAYVAACAGAMALLWKGTASAGGFERAMLVTMLGWVPLFFWVVLAPGYRAAGLAAIAGVVAPASAWAWS